MTYEPRSTEEIYESFADSLRNRITKLTNFTNRSFNAIWTAAFAEEVRELEERALASELSGWIDYVGGPVTQEDLDDLGISNSIDVDTVNEYMEDQHLDEYVKIVGLTRFEGDRASGTVTITTQDDEVNIPEGTTVTTAPDENGETIEFETTESVTSQLGETSISGINIQAVDVGERYNVPADKIIRFADPPIGVRSVTNPEATAGGQEIESNESLRTRAKNAVSGAGEGGTADGITSYIQDSVEGVQQGDVIIEEFTDREPPFVDVIVDGGTESDVTGAIDFSRPTGIRHNLVRPEVIQVGVDSDLLGQDIDITSVESDIESFFLSLAISQEFYQNKLIEEIMQSDNNILNIDRLNTTIERVTNEQIEYVDGKSEYRLEYTYEETNGSITVRDRDGNEYFEGDDFTVDDQTGDGWPETIVFGIGASPNAGDILSIDYDVTVPDQTLTEDEYGTDLVRDEIFTFNLDVVETFDYSETDPTYRLGAAPFKDAITIEDNGGTTYTQGSDWQLAPLIPGTDRDEIQYTTGTTEYTLSEDVRIDDVAIIDENQNLYVRGTDFTVTDSDGDGAKDTISWDTNNSVPADGVTFIVNYNGHSRTIRWSQNASSSEPTGGDEITVTYDQKLYSTEEDITTTPNGEIRDASGDVYTEGTEYTLSDCSCDGELSAILWNENPSTLDAGEEFYITYNTEGNVLVENREKVDPGTIETRIV